MKKGTVNRGGSRLKSTQELKKLEPKKGTLGSEKFGAKKSTRARATYRVEVYCIQHAVTVWQFPDAAHDILAAWLEAPTG